MLVMEMSNKKHQIPAIRFNGFTDAWEQHKLGDFSDVTKLAGFEFTKYVEYSDSGKIIALRGLNVKNGNLVLDDVTLQMLQHITTFSDNELKEALDAVAAQQAKRRLKRKKK